MATFGNTASTNTYNHQVYGGYIYMSPAAYTLSEAGTGNSLSVYAKGAADGSQVYRLVIYAADGAGGIPGTFVAATAEMSLSSADSTYDWRTGNIASPPLSAADYWLGIWVGATSQKSYFNVTNASATGTWYTETYHATNDPTAITLDAGGDTGTFSLFCTYTASGGVSGQVAPVGTRFIPSLGG